MLILAGCGKKNNDGDIAEPCAVHTDTDDNGMCDECKMSVLVYLDLYSINDLHGKFEDTDSQPGVDELTTYLLNEKKRSNNVILLSAGDMWQGSPESNLTEGALMTEWMNELGFAAMTLGNHEFDWGESAIEENDALAEFPFLAINIFDRDTNERAEYCRPSVTLELEGVTVGIIGAIGDCYSSIAPDHSGGIYFKTGRELDSLVMAESKRLRENGADVIVYLVHDGGGSVSDNITDGYVDVVFEGHSHKSYVRTDGNGVYHLQGGGDNDGLSYVTMTFNTANQKVSVLNARVFKTDSYQHMPDAPIVGELLEKYKDEIAEGDEILGQNASLRRSDYLCSLVARLYYEKGIELWSKDYDIILGGGYLSARSPYELEKGDVKYGDLYSIFPFDNPLVLCSVKGRDLIDKFIETNNSKYYVYMGKNPEEIAKNIDENGTYYIVVDSYTSTYAPNRLTEIVRFEQSLYARDLLAEFIKNGGLA